MNYLVVVDSFSKWFVVVQMKSTTASRTYVELRKLFAQHGRPEELVSDNGTQFIASEIEVVMRSNGETYEMCTVPPRQQCTGGESGTDIKVGATQTHTE